jgi:predicted Zn finger-like uncharacterized protein
MRLVCPNCEAKYEVPDDAIPDTGRDVQCTNCGHTWFQMRGRIGAAPLVPPAPAELEMPEPEVTAVEAVETPAPMPQAVPAPEPESPPADLSAADMPTEIPEAVSDSSEATLAEAAPADAPATADATSDALSGDEGDAAVEPEPDVAVLPEAQSETETIPTEEVLSTTDSQLSSDIGPVESGADGPAAADTAAPASALDPVAEVVAEVISGDDDSSDRPGLLSEAVAEAAAEAANETPAPAVSTYAVDESVLAILREEAEREANARRAEALESQTDLGIDAAMPRKGAALAEAEAKPAARRDLLPDVEEINSTLRPSEAQLDADGTPDFVAPPPEAPRGFRSGFLSLMTVAILAAALYLVAPRLAVLVPALSGPLETYVSMVDSMRLGLDGLMRSATVAISDN